MFKPDFLLQEVIEYLHDRAIQEYGGSPGILDEGLLQSALSRAEFAFSYADHPLDLFDLAAAYAFGFAKNHAFFDGNKRTAWATCVAFLRLNNEDVVCSDLDKEERMVMLADNLISEQAFASWLRSIRLRDPFAQRDALD